MLVCLSGHLHRRIIINIAPRGFKIRRRRSYTVFPHIVSALEKFPYIYICTVTFDIMH